MPAREPIAVVILAAGLGTRMMSDLPKALHPLAGRPMIAHLIESVAGLAPERVVVVIGPDMGQMARTVAPHPVVVQEQRRGTGHALAQARGALAGFAGTVLVLNADNPLVETATLADLVAARGRAALAVLGFRPADPGAYGRLITSPEGLERIVEAKDASPAELAVGLCNSNAMAVDGRLVWGLVERLSDANARREYYLTDIVAIARADGHACAWREAPADEMVGINSRAELAAAEALAQRRLRLAAMAGGATLVAPETVHFAWDTRLGRDVTVGPNVVFGPGVTVADHVEIRAFCHIEGASIAAGAIVGPFARLRPGAEIGPEAHIGNFVEVKAAVVERAAKINHLSYVGDARVGARTNIGAGTITCNYDGFTKSTTDIGADVFVGSNAALVAPVKLGDGAMVAAGSVITEDVPGDALALGRARQSTLPGRAAAFRARRSAGRKKTGS